METTRNESGNLAATNLQLDKVESKRSLCKMSSSDFAEIKETITFVDKTLFIKTVLSDPRKTELLTAPRGFGKTTLMNMLKQFLLGKTDLFKNLKITEDEEFFSKHCKPHPVIHIDFRMVRGNSYDEVKRSLALAINKTFQEHEYLVKETDGGTRVWASEKLKNSHKDIKWFEKFYDVDKCINLGEAELAEDSLQFLSQVLHTHYEEGVFLLIDENDAPAIGLVFDDFANENDINRIYEFLKRFMGSTLTLRFNEFIKRSLIFACVRLAKPFSGNATRLTHYPFLSDVRYAPYLGFTDTEVQQLLERPEVIRACGNLDFDEITKWYDGYMASNSALKIFSSQSVLNFLETVVTTGTVKYSSFWIDTGHAEKLKEVFAEPFVRNKLEDIIYGSTVKIMTGNAITWVGIEHLKNLKKLISLEFDKMSWESMDLFLLFLADSGYFNILSVEMNTTLKLGILKIPNLEIREHIINTCYSEALMIVNEYNLTHTNIEKYLDALKLVLERKSEKEFVELANAILVLLSKTPQRITTEKELRHILYTLAFNSRYFITSSEVQIMKNRMGPGITNTLDVVIILRNIGIIFEYKMNSQSAQEALHQIFEKGYYTKFDEPKYEYIFKKIYAGLAFDTEANKVFITFQVGNEGKSISVCSDTLL